jgi:hypothetical protein
LKVRVPLLIKDKMATDFIGVKRMEGFEITDELFFPARYR